jgi:nucleoside-diphosphate-sugar epimerase
MHDTEFVKIRIDAQKFLEENCKKVGMGLVVAHLADIVYGNGGFFKLMISDRLSKGTFRIPGDGKYMKNFIHVDDAAGAISAIIQKGENGTYLLTDSTPAPFKEFVNYLADCMKIKRPKTVPAVLAKLVLSSDAINLLMRSTVASNKKILQIYDFKFPSYKEGIMEFVKSMI